MRGGRRDRAARKTSGSSVGGGISTNLGDLVMEVTRGPGVLQDDEVGAAFGKGGLFPMQK